MSTDINEDQQTKVYNYLRLSDPKDRRKGAKNSLKNVDAVTPESGNFSLSSSSSSLNEMSELRIQQSKNINLVGKRVTGSIDEDSSGLCTNSDGESSKTGMLSNSSTANLSSDSACQNVTSSSEEDEQPSEKEQQQRIVTSENKPVEVVTGAYGNSERHAVRNSATAIENTLNRPLQEKNKKDVEELEEKQTINFLKNKTQENNINLFPAFGKHESEPEKACKNQEEFKNKTFSGGFKDNPFNEEQEETHKEHSIKRQHQSSRELLNVRFYKQSTCNSNNNSPYSPIYQPHSRDILNTSKGLPLESNNFTQNLVSQTLANNNLHNFNQLNPNSSPLPPKSRPKSLDPTLSSRLSRNSSQNTPRNSSQIYRKLSNKSLTNNFDQNRIELRKSEESDKSESHQRKQNSNSSRKFNQTCGSKSFAKPKSPHPVRRLQSFIHQKNSNRPILIKKRSASDDDDDDDEGGGSQVFSDSAWQSRQGSYNAKLAPVTSPASTTILKASPSLNAISPCASRTIYNRMQPTNKEISDKNENNSLYSKAGSFFLTVASKVADNLRSTPTSPVRHDNSKLFPVSEFGRQFTSTIKQSFSDMNLASYNNQRKNIAESHKSLRQPNPTNNKLAANSNDILKTHFLNPAHAARNYKPHKNHVYDSINVKRSHTTQDLCSFQRNMDNKSCNEPIFEEEEEGELEWDDYLPDTNVALCDDISSQASFGQASSIGQASQFSQSSVYSSASENSSKCKIRNWGDQALNEISQMIQNDEQQHRECVREGAKVFDWPSHAIVDKLNVGLTIAEE